MRLNKALAFLTFVVIFGFFAQTVSAYYSPEVGRFISRDPIEYNAGDINVYRYVENNTINAKDSVGLLFEKTGPFGSTTPGLPSTLKGDGRCRIAIHCWPVTRMKIPLGTHCGLTLDYNGSITHLDGSGGDTNQIEQDNISGATTFTSYKDFSGTKCKCLLDYISKFNSQKIPRNNTEGNSNWTLSCMVSNCGLKINWGTSSPPTSYGIAPCKKYKTTGVPHPHNPNICVPLRECEERYSCP
jgi:hypothetical protein